MTTAAITILGAHGCWPHPLAGDLYKAKNPGWIEVTEENWEYGLEVLPPIYFKGGFATSEAHDHDDTTGQAVYACWVSVGKRYFLRLMTIKQAPAEAEALRDFIQAGGANKS